MRFTPEYEIEKGTVLQNTEYFQTYTYTSYTDCISCTCAASHACASSSSSRSIMYSLSYQGQSLPQLAQRSVASHPEGTRVPGGFLCRGEEQQVMRSLPRIYLTQRTSKNKAEGPATKHNTRVHHRAYNIWSRTRTYIPGMIYTQYDCRTYHIPDTPLYSVLRYPYQLSKIAKLRAACGVPGTVSRVPVTRNSSL